MITWRQDNAYFKISDPMKGTALWTAVHQATVANGTMEIIPAGGALFFAYGVPHCTRANNTDHERAG